MSKNIYLILSSSSSVPAKLIKFFTHNKLNHSSIALEPSLTKMFSFGRLKMWNAFYAGFVVENKDKGFYQKFTDTYIQLYAFPVSDETYLKTKIYLEKCENEKTSFKYNMIGTVLSKFKIPLVREKQYFCSEFVAVVFKECNIREMKGDIHIYHPYNFLDLPNKKLLYDGMLADYRVENIPKH
ncbi:MAG: hypothetical protein RSA79_03370 [Oscillospiraceae bacterium]